MNKTLTTFKNDMTHRFRWKGRLTPNIGFFHNLSIDIERMMHDMHFPIPNLLNTSNSANTDIFQCLSVDYL